MNMNTTKTTSKQTRSQKMYASDCSLKFDTDIIDILAKPIAKDWPCDRLTFDSVSTRDDENSLAKSSLNYDPSSYLTHRRKSKKEQPYSNITTLKEIVTKRKYTKRKQSVQGEAESKFLEPKLRKKEKKEQEHSLQSLTQDSIKSEDVNTHLKSQDQHTKLVLHNGRVTLEDQQLTSSSSDELIPVSAHKNGRLTTSQSYKKLAHTEKWAEKETRKFFRALEIFGTDFSMIAALFPTRTRMQIKNKFVKEEKSNPERVNSIFSKKAKGRSLRLLRRMNFLKSNHAVIKEAKEENGLTVGPRRRTDSINSLLSTDSLDIQIIQEMSDLLSTNRTFKI